MKKYRVIKPVESRRWEVGDIVSMDDRSALLAKEMVMEYTGDEEHKHVAIMVDPVPVSGNIWHQ